MADENINEIKKESTLNNNVINSTGPKIEANIEADDKALSKVIDKESPLEIIRNRNVFYQDGYRTMQKIVVMEAFVILALILMFLMLFAFSRPKDRFFATTADGKLIKLSSLEEPLLKKPAILNFASEAATQVMTFGFHDYRARLQEASENFTTDGWESFLEALNQAKYIETITNGRQVISAVPVAPPVIVSEGVDKGIYKWMVEVPLAISIEAGSKIATKKILVRMVISRRSKVLYEKGLGIDQWVTTAYSESR